MKSKLISVAVAAVISTSAMADCQSDWQETVDRAAPFASTIAGKTIEPDVVMSGNSNAYAWVYRNVLSKVYVNVKSCSMSAEMREAVVYHELGHMVSFVKDPEIMSSGRFPAAVTEAIADDYAAKMARLSGTYDKIVAAFTASCNKDARDCQHLGSFTVQY